MNINTLFEQSTARTHHPPPPGLSGTEPLRPVTRCQWPHAKRNYGLAFETVTAAYVPVASDGGDNDDDSDSEPRPLTEYERFQGVRAAARRWGRAAAARAAGNR